MNSLIRKILTPLIPITAAGALFFTNPQGLKAEEQNPIVPSTVYVSGGFSDLKSINKDVDKTYGQMFMIKGGIGADLDTLGGLEFEFDIAGGLNYLNILDLSAKVAKIFNFKGDVRPYVGFGQGFGFIPGTLDSQGQNAFGIVMESKFFTGLNLSSQKYAFDFEVGFKLLAANPQGKNMIDFSGLYSEASVKYKF